MPGSSWQSGAAAAVGKGPEGDQGEAGSRGALAVIRVGGHRGNKERQEINLSYSRKQRARTPAEVAV